jgi:hypothetical protein
MFFRTVMPGGWAGHLSKKSDTFLFAELILASIWQTKSSACCAHVNSELMSTFNVHILISFLKKAQYLRLRQTKLGQTMCYVCYML